MYLSDPPGGGGVRLDALALAATRGVIQGSSGSGKSFLARLIAEGAADRMPVIVIDPEGEYQTLRERCSMVLVGPGGEIRADPSTAGMVAVGLLRESCSAIVDLSDLRSSEHNDYVGAFVGAMMGVGRSVWRPTLVVIDEAHRFCPEGGGKRSESSSSAIRDLMARGRKRGYGGVLVTQRISKLRKDAVAEAANQFFGVTYQDVDIKRTADNLGMSPKDALVFRSLKSGEWFAHGPALSASESAGREILRFRARLPKTSPPDPAAHCAPGVKHAGAVKKLADAVAASIESSAGPLTLEEALEEIASLKLRLSAASDLVAPDASEALNRARRAEKAWRTAVLGRERLESEMSERLESARARLSDLQEHLRVMRDALSEAEELISAMDYTLPDSCSGPGSDPVKYSADNPPQRAMDRPASPAIAGPSSQQTSQPDADRAVDPRVNGNAEERVLAALAWWASVGVRSPSSPQVCIVAGLSPKSSTYRAARASLRREGLVEYHGSRTKLTTDGVVRAGPAPVPSITGWHRMIRDQIGGGADLRVFDYLLERGPCSKEDLASGCGLSASSSTLRGALAKLRKLGLVRAGNPLALSDLARPDGLA